MDLIIRLVLGSLLSATLMVNTTAAVLVNGVEKLLITVIVPLASTTRKSILWKKVRFVKCFDK